MMRAIIDHHHDERCKHPPESAADSESGRLEGEELLESGRTPSQVRRADPSSSQAG